MNSEQQNKRLLELQYKWLTRTISADELAELDAWYHSQESDDIHIPREFAASEAALEQRILASIKSRQKTGTAPLIPLYVLKWMAAACIILIAGWASYRYLIKSEPAKTIVHNDSKPGYNHALLKLADGTTVVLDSANNGTIQQQGNVMVLRSAGELKYQVGEALVGEPIVYNTMITPRGGQYKIVLADGTIVWLNSASEIRFPAAFTGKERIVEFKGEAFFEIAKDPSKPFRVKVGEMEVEVLGTEFNIDAYEDENTIRTTLINGNVNVKAGKTAKLKLLPGQQAKVLNKAPGEIELVKNVDVEDVVSWQKGIFQFRNTDLSVIARQLSRWYDVEIRTEGNVENIEFGGGISKKLSLIQILSVFEKSGIKHKWNNSKLILYAL